MTVNAMFPETRSQGDCLLVPARLMDWGWCARSASVEDRRDGAMRYWRLRGARFGVVDECGGCVTEVRYQTQVAADRGDVGGDGFDLHLGGLAVFHK